MRKIALMLVGVFLMAEAGPAAAVVEYTGKGHRDPFGLTDGAARSAEKHISDIRVQGIVWNTNEPRAIINNKMVKIGSKIGTAEVTGIDKEGVRIQESGQEFILRPGGKGAR